jgi:hypothetical protein
VGVATGAVAGRPAEVGTLEARSLSEAGVVRSLPEAVTRSLPDAVVRSLPEAVVEVVGW